VCVVEHAHHLRVSNDLTIDNEIRHELSDEVLRVIP
jgi:hypothetical protein